LLVVRPGGMHGSSESPLLVASLGLPRSMKIESFCCSCERYQAFAVPESCRFYTSGLPNDPFRMAPVTI